MSAIEVASKPCSRKSSHAASASVSRDDALGLPVRGSGDMPLSVRVVRVERVLLDAIQKLATSEGAPCSTSRRSASPRTTCPYLDGWALQRRIHAEVVDGARPDTLLLMEHEPVYTAGARTARHERPTDGTPVVDVDRGGKITWHGPGQLVGYPIVRLPEPLDVVAHVRASSRC